jgi:hypothetical protein
MSNNNFADVKISIPDGTLRTTSVIVNGIDLSRFTNKVEFSISGDDPIAMVTLTLLANISIDGKLAIKTTALEGVVFRIDG